MAHIPIYKWTVTRNQFGQPGWIKNNWDSTVSPTTAEDVTKGYTDGSMWIDQTAGNIYILEDQVAGTWVQLNGGGGGAPTTVDYLVGTADAGLSAEIVVGTTPGGELAGGGSSWASPVVTDSHAGETHASIQSAAEATAAADTDADITTHEGLADPHTGYRLETGDHTHATTGAQAGTISHDVLDDVSIDDHHARDHAATHVSGGADPIKLDDFATPDDNTNLDASLTEHGLLPKLGGGTTNFFRADGTYAAPTGSHAASHVLATGTALGPDHTISGAAAGEYLRALSSTTAAFDAIQDADIPATHSGSAHHTKYLDSEAIAAVEGEATLVLTGALTGVSDPSTGVGVGDRDYNDARYLAIGDVHGDLAGLTGNNDHPQYSLVFHKHPTEAASRPVIGDWSAATEQTVSGTAEWTEVRDETAGRNILSVKYASQSTGDMAVILKPIGGAVPRRITTAFRFLARSTNYQMLGLVFTDGTDTSSKVVWAQVTGGNHSLNAYMYRTGTLTTFNAAFTSYAAPLYTQGGVIHMRLTWVAANEFKMELSIDGTTWSDFGVSNPTPTITPTHVGFGVSVFGTSTERMAAFEYFIDEKAG